jgi:hypothetical protein
MTATPPAWPPTSLVYLPPIQPNGQSHRAGPDHSLVAGPAADGVVA